MKFEQGWPHCNRTFFFWPLWKKKSRSRFFGEMLYQVNGTTGSSNSLKPEAMLVFFLGVLESRYGYLKDWLNPWKMDKELPKHLQRLRLKKKRQMERWSYQTMKNRACLPTMTQMKKLVTGDKTWWRMWFGDSGEGCDCRIATPCCAISVECICCYGDLNGLMYVPDPPVLHFVNLEENNMQALRIYTSLFLLEEVSFRRSQARSSPFPLSSPLQVIWEITLQFCRISLNH